MSPDSSLNIHDSFMRRAIELARRGIGSTHPNPRVGAVVVNNGKVVGEGWHEYPGGPHGEAAAISSAGVRAKGATLYVTLEPCSAHGRTPPCTDAIRAAGIARVVYASSDPNPKMAGGGRVLAASHIDVIGGVMKEEADLLNRPFFHFIETGRPYVTAKAAISLDGKLATHRQHSQWISGPESRLHAHGVRAEVDAIVIGAGTLHYDNPSLTVRDVEVRGSVPIRVVLCFETPPFAANCKLLSSDAPVRFYVRSSNEHTEKWRAAGVQIEQLNSLDAILRHLAGDGYLHLLLEGGGTLLASFFDGRFADEVLLYQAPILIGGHDAVSLWGGTGVESVDHALRLSDIERRQLGNDQMIRGQVVYPV
ncbi:bifunctional diaminohydroxyphosphoribosylaminopyrimidine deaminase/5-amino-6-(5-phosphoribosylamino)uracil reductase RibD [Mariprofundus ferrinatatus]|nr:bifunctional diaminohydroxyphosphoribosylaminopyrimidine deaminase/5-amino-6-(5-phosphoribosylamino)uracil reductase RibD [Mariprofundus ferrinatatus]